MNIDIYNQLGYTKLSLWILIKLACSSSGKDAGLSRRKQGFNSPTGYQIKSNYV